MAKKVTFGANPTAAKPTSQPTADQWVEARAAEEPIKRLTIDLPASLHARIKSTCALRGTKMVDEIRALLEERFPS